MDELCAIRHFVDKSDQVTSILVGLPEEYDPIVMNAGETNQNAPISDAYVHGLLLNMEIRLSCHWSSTSSDQITFALFTLKNRSSTHSRRGAGRSSHRGRG